MSEIITFSDQTPQGTFAQVKLDDGRRILISLTKTEIAVLRLVMKGLLPIKKIWKHDLLHYIMKYLEKNPQEIRSPLKFAVDEIVLIGWGQVLKYQFLKLVK